MSSSPASCSSASPGTLRNDNSFGLGGIEEFEMNSFSGSSSTSLPDSRGIFVKFSKEKNSHLQTFMSNLSKADMTNLLGPLHLPAFRSISTETLHTSPKLEPRRTGPLPRSYPPTGTGDRLY